VATVLHAVTLLKLHQARTRGPTWRTTTRKARASPARLSPSTFSGPYARGVRTWSAMSMPKQCTPPALSPGLARDRAHGTLFTNTGSPPRRRLAMAKGRRPRLHLLISAPPVSPAAPGSTHLRVGVALTPLPKASAPPLQPGPWRPMTLGRAGAQTERLRASGAI